MANFKLKNFQTLDFSGWASTVTKRNHISSMFAESPQKATINMVKLLASYTGKTMEAFLRQFPVKEFESDQEYTWDVIGSSRRNIPLASAIDENGTAVTADTAAVGVGVAPFYLIFSEMWFFKGEVIAGELNEAYQFRILEEPIEYGTNYKYKVELIGGNTVGCPGSQLVAGKRFSVLFAPAERELSRKMGGINHATPISMRNEWSTIRIQDKVSGGLLDRKLACGMPVAKETANGYQVDTVTMWMHYEDFKIEEKFSEYKSNLIMFGRSNRNANGEYLNYGFSGEVIRMGDGLRAQMEVANTIYYTDFSLKLIDDALYQLTSTKLEFKDRKFILKTGEKGARQFSEAALREGTGWTRFDYEGTKSGLGLMVSTTSAHVPFGGAIKVTSPQVTEFISPSGNYLKVEVDPLYDDPVRNKIKHPEGGVAESYRYDIYDIGSMDQPNIFICKIKGQEEYHGIQYGLRDPFTGRTNNMNMSFDEDAAVFHKMATLGVCVLDPTRTMSIIPSILSAE